MMNRVFVLFLRAAVMQCLAVAVCGAATAGGQQRQIRFAVTIDLGKDVGQDFGALFEATDDRGRVVAGAGFMEVYNTRFRHDRHTLQFFVRPDADTPFTVERLPHPDLDLGVYLFALDGELHAWSSVKGNSVRVWRDEHRRWEAARQPETGPLRSGDGMMRLADGMLVFTSNRVTFKGREILAEPAIGRYHNFYYAAGRLCFYHTHRIGEDGGFTRIYACPWTPQRGGGADLSEAAIFETPYVGETPFAFGQYHGQILTVSNVGGVYAFDGQAWKTILPGERGVSFQIYSILNYYDRLLLAQYPTGNLFEFRGRDLKLLEGSPPRLPGVSPRAREAQTMAIYRGDLFVGVWPWAEVWRRDRDADKWWSLGRMFSHPAVSDQTVHPYEAEAKRLGLVLNHWGQRVTSMVPLGDSLFLATSSKGTSEWSPEYGFLSEEARREYGAVLRLKMAGNLAARIRWTGEPISLELVVDQDRMLIEQDGRLLAETPLDPPLAARLDPSSVRWGEGVFGPLNGELTSARWEK